MEPSCVAAMQQCSYARGGCFFCCQQDFFHSYIIHNSVLHFHMVLLVCESAPLLPLHEDTKLHFSSEPSLPRYSGAPDSDGIEKWNSKKCYGLSITIRLVFARHTKTAIEKHVSHFWCKSCASTTFLKNLGMFLGKTFQEAACEK